MPMTLLQNQIEYYRARAPEYDDWFYRRERYDQGEAHTRQWQREIQHVRDQLYRITDLGHILELAPGTGIWTAELIQIGERVSALDASPEMIEINRAKLGSGRVEYQLADLFRLPAGAPIRHGLLRLLAVARAGRQAVALPQDGA